MSIIDHLWAAIAGDPSPMRQPVPFQDDAATIYQAGLISENRALKAELRRLNYSDFYIETLVNVQKRKPQ